VIRIQPGQHVTIVGQNGTGKSWMGERAFALAWPRGIIIDHKHESTCSGYQIARGLRQFDQLWPEVPRVIFRPTFRSPQEEIDLVLNRAFYHGNTGVLIHEAMQICDSRTIPPGYQRALTMGRVRRVSIVSCTQRPMHVHNTVFSESKHFFVFFLLLEGDRRKISGFAGPTAAGVPGQEYGFFYYGPSMTDAVEMPPLRLAA
jgi:ABC-type dipeptide/oligopeptide/nickel transport system ATPase component